MINSDWIEGQATGTQVNWELLRGERLMGSEEKKKASSPDDLGRRKPSPQYFDLHLVRHRLQDILEDDGFWDPEHVEIQLEGIVRLIGALIHGYETDGEDED